MSNELIEVGDNSPAVNSFEMVDVQSAKAFMDNYQEVCKALLDNSDFQKVRMNGKETAFKKKSAWRKIATAFNISDDVIKEVIIRDDNYQIISATFHVRATAPNGRSGIGVASCSIFDKINKKDKEQPSNFELRNRYNNAENDVIGTAHTRAKSRAISDLVGMGEVSAEELGEMGVIEKPKKVSVKPKTKPKAAAKPKTTPKPKDDDAIEVQVVSGDSPSKSLKQLIDEDENIKKLVDELIEEHQTVNRFAIEERLLKWLEAGAIKEEDYKKAKEVMN